ncbi:sensor histidine kinase [Paramaledivibacter caminithermalis]|uniref:histidine kinase n=1 Tax=Paramaledivibacter caminithermalis (strain DSM 15212 / CIP 107654 / DViRD3) TaxID=1121301 RepID=A0A1M6MS40_PARC5|nr:HAMP domain-containing sensor histidine kinase [Paramaledivibacter caminithermalis]SHJ86291.1 Signal transduction histidine kinase [Paramaledivibacter caminithermalis DSM 15212]
MKSLLSKSWLGITSLVLIMLLLIWLFQIVLLNQFYINERKNILLDEGNKLAALFLESNNYKVVPQSVIDEIESWSHSYNARVAIIDSNGNMLFYNVPKEFLKDKKSLIERFRKNMFDFYNNWEIKTKFSQDKTFVLKKDYKQSNRPYIMVGVPINKNGKIIANILITSPLAPIQEATSILKKQLSIISIVSLFIGTVLALLFAKHFTRPILKITETSRRIAKGDFTANVNLNSKDEIGVLGNTINDMAHQLAQIENFRREFIANTSHELKTPISLIRAYSELIKDNIAENNRSNAEYLQIIIDEANRLNSMVEDILYLSKMESGYSKINYESYPIIEIINNTIEKLSFFAFQKCIDINLQIDDKKTLIYADKQKIYQVFYNIINNAINHSYENSQINIRVNSINNICKVEIIDSGKGIPEEDLPYIWDRFYKVDKSRKRDSSGTGLGMAIVKNILDAHNFKYGIESEVNKGTKVWFEISKNS